MSKEQKKIAVSSIFNLLSTYSIFFLGIINTFFIARLITPYEWGILLFAIMFIGVAAYFCYFFPPAAESTIQYYIPRLKNGDYTDKNEIRTFILHTYKIRFLFTIIIYVIFFLIIHLINFEGKFLQTLFIISPLIIITVIQNINTSILLAFQKFRKIFYVHIVSIIICNLGNIILYILKIEYPLIFVAGLYLLAALVSFLVSTMFIIPLIPSKTPEITIDKSLKKESYFKIHTKYGLFIVLSGVVSNISGLIISFLFFYFGVIMLITYIMICETIVALALNISGSSRSSFISIFSEINYEENPKKYVTTLYQLNKYLLLFLCIIVATLFFFVEIYINLIYTETYLVIILAIQIFLFSTFARVITRNLLIITQSTNRTVINLKLTICQGIFYSISTIVALLFFDFTFLILFYVISRFINPVYLIYLINRESEFNLKFTTLFKPFLIFLISFFISLPFIWIIDFQIYSHLSLVNLLFNSILRFSIFCISFYLIILLSKYITKEEFNLLITIIPIFNFKNKLFQKLIKIAIKLFPSEKSRG